MKNGLIYENDELIYYKDDRPQHAGVIEVDGDIYYIGRHGRATKGYHIVHGEMTNGLLKHGTYRFGDDYKLVKGSYIAPKRTKKTKKNRNKQKIKSKKAVYIISLSVVLLFTLAILLYEFSSAKPTTSIDNNAEHSIILPKFDEEVLLCSPAAKKLYDGEISASIACESGDPYRPFAFQYVLKNQDGQLLLSEQADLSDAKEYVLSCRENVLYIHHLKTGTNYYYRVTVEGKTYDGQFKTAESTRFLSIPGLQNTRDIGGVSTLDGNKVKQGLIIRGTEMDGLVEPSYFLKATDIPAVQEEFGFVCDFDLRADMFTHSNSSRLGSDVKHPLFGTSAYGSIFMEAYQPALKSAFSALADPTNYPMYMHCTYGADRTGTLIFLLQGVLGVSETDMQREYRTTGFAINGYDTSDNMDVIIAGLEHYPGDTLQEKIVYFLTETVGVTQAEIDSIRSILLEK